MLQRPMHVSAIVLTSAFGLAAATAADDGRPPSAAIALTGKPQAQLAIDAAQWGEWIADVEKPQTSGFSGRGLDIAAIDGVPVNASAPRPRGSVKLLLTQPWPKCAVGDRFNGVYLTIGATHKYQLGEGVIVGCSTGSVTINYTSVSPRS